MNRIEFMRELESLLQNISPTEREEALQYYNDYFNDAGVENEQTVIESLGNPAKVAETIRKDLAGNNNEEIPFQREVPEDKAVVTYEQVAKSGADADKASGPDMEGRENQDTDKTGTDNRERKGSFQSVWENMGSPVSNDSSVWKSMFNQSSDTQTDRQPDSVWQNDNSTQNGGYQNGNAQAGGYQNNTQYDGYQNGSAQAGGYQNNTQYDGCQNGSAQAGGYQNNTQYDGYQNGNAGYGGFQNGNAGYGGCQNNAWQNNAGQNGSFDGNYGYGAYNQSAGGYSMPVEKKKMSTGMIVLIVVLCLILSPAIFSVVTGIAGIVFGLLAGWFGMILGFGITAIVLIILAFVLACIGVAGMFVSPFGGLGMVGGGPICAGLGVLFLMLTIAMSGVATPAIFRGIKWVWNSIFGKRKAA